MPSTEQPSHVAYMLPEVDDSEGFSSNGVPSNDSLVRYPPECEFCAEMFLQSDGTWLSAKFLHDLFHEECATCTYEDLSLCDGCRHLKLRHLTLCTRERLPGTRIPVPHIRDKVMSEEPSGCPICSFMTESMLDEDGSMPTAWSVDELAEICIMCSEEPPREPRGTSLDLYESINHFQVSWSVQGGETVLRTEAGVGFKSPASSSMCPASATPYQTPAMEHPQQVTSQDSSLGARSDTRDWSLSPQVRSEVVDWEAMKETIAICNTKHPNCHSSGLRPPPDFRLIDTENRCLVKLQGPTEFCALSYVWGRERSLESLQSERCKDLS